MQWHLNYIPPKSGFTIDHDKKIFLIGSCFSENIGTLLSDHKFYIQSNPGGILFNPKSIHTFLRHSIENKNFDKKYILLRDGLFYSYLHHTSINDQHDEVLKDKINSITSGITFGSAFIYEHKELDEPVANCHKQPQATFNKRLLDVEEIVKDYTRIISELQTLNPKLQIIFTVSPVKYLKDGVIENNQSKSILLLAANELSKYKNCSYFPAFELVNDDLRDYRFYKEDLAHPNEQAINYVWEKFSDCFFLKETQTLNREIKKLNSALGHRLMNEDSDEAEKLNQFISKQKEEIKKLNPKIQINT
jgi:hypothetical protein